MTAVQILRAGRELLSDPARVAKGAFALDIKGRAVDVRSKHAVCWCSEGAFHKVDDRACNADGDKALASLRMAFWELKGTSIILAHDASDHPTALRAWDRAIELAEAA